MTTQLFPIFYLYGEPHRQVGEDFVHLESLDDRSRPSEWTIDPHGHADLCHVFVLWTGGGSMSVDGDVARFAAPCLLLIPVAMIHGFDWHEDTSGAVVTLAARYVADLCRAELALQALFETARSVPLKPESHDKMRALVAELKAELGWSAVGHRAAVDAVILSMLVVAARTIAIAQAPGHAPGHQAMIVARFRARIEDRFRLREPMADYAAALGVSETALRAACAKVAGCSPAKLLDQRAFLEARRALVYSNLSIAEVGFAIGFGDPAYFSRFFRRHAGQSPAGYRTRG